MIYYFKFEHEDKGRCQVRIPANDESYARFLFKTVFADGNDLTMKLFKVQPMTKKNSTDLDKIIVYSEKEGKTYETLIPEIFKEEIKKSKRFT